MSLWSNAKLTACITLVIRRHRARKEGLVSVCEWRGADIVQESRVLYQFVNGVVQTSCKKGESWISLWMAWCMSEGLSGTFKYHAHWLFQSASNEREEGPMVYVALRMCYALVLPGVYQYIYVIPLHYLAHSIITDLRGTSLEVTWRGGIDTRWYLMISHDISWLWPVKQTGLVNLPAN